MFLFIELKFLIIIALLFIIFFGIIGWIIYSVVKRKNKLTILMVRDKFTPMAGNFYLFIDSQTGQISKDRNGEKCMFFDTKAEAQFILDQYEAQKDKPFASGSAAFY